MIPDARLDEIARLHEAGYYNPASEHSQAIGDLLQHVADLHRALNHEVYRGDKAREERNTAEQHLQEAHAQIAQLREDLGTCYRLSGGDNSKADTEAAEEAITQVCRMFHERNDLRQHVAQAEAARKRAENQLEYLREQHRF